MSRLIILFVPLHLHIHDLLRLGCNEVGWLRSIPFTVRQHLPGCAPHVGQTVRSIMSRSFLLATFCLARLVRLFSALRRREQTGQSGAALFLTLNCCSSFQTTFSFYKAFS